MIWLGVAVGVAAIALLVATAVRRRRRASDGRSVDDVDPLFTTGIVLTGAGAALATSRSVALGPPGRLRFEWASRTPVGDRLVGAWVALT